MSRPAPAPRAPRLIALVRLMLGLEFVVNGLNWWVKLIGPYPSISDFTPGHPPPPDFVGAMIATGFLFHIVKAVELAAGIALLADRFVPLALVASFPVTINVFLVDVVIQHHLRGFVMGAGALAMTGALMLAYLDSYRPMLASHAAPGPLPPPAGAALPALAAVAAAFGAAMLSWVAVMIAQHFGS